MQNRGGSKPYYIPGNRRIELPYETRGMGSFLTETECHLPHEWEKLGLGMNIYYASYLRGHDGRIVSSKLT